MFQWLNHSPVPTNDFKHREFSLWLHNDAVMRYQSYTTSDLSASPCRPSFGQG
jgi:DNA primase small subunit